MNRDSIITELYRSGFIEKDAPKFVVCREYQEDIIAEIYLIVCEVSGRKLERLYKEGGMEKVKRYVAGIITRQLRSKRSRVYYKYVNHRQHEVPAEKMTIWQGDQEKTGQ